MSMAAPEPYVEGMFNILKLILSGNTRIDINNINDKYILRSFCKNEFDTKVKEFLYRANKSYLSQHRGPITTSRTTKKYGTVLDKIFDELDVNIDVDLEYDDNLKGDYSDSDEDVLVNIDNINGNGITLQ